MQEQAAVTYVMPVLNEADHLEEAVRAILDQRYGGASELVLALGPSTDDTDAVADRARRAAEWLTETVLRRALPVPNMERLLRAGA